MRIDEVIQQPGQKERALKNDILRTLHVATPGEVVSYDSTKRTVTVQPVIRDWGCKDDPPLLTDVPVFFIGNYTFTPQKGDGCLVVFADSCIDAWLQSGGVSTPVSSRTHSLSDGFAFIGFNQTGGTPMGGGGYEYATEMPMSETDSTKVYDAVVAKADNNTVVHKAGTETISGAKIFTNAPYMEGQHPRVLFKPPGGDYNGAVRLIDSGTGTSGEYGQAYFMFYEMSPSSDGKSLTGNYERYALPKPEIGMSTKPIYDILTSKTPVTVEQGGTGSTTAADARTALDVPSNSEAVHKTGREEIGGAKLFTDMHIINNDSEDPAILFRPFGLSSSNAIICAEDSGVSGSTYGSPRFAFRVYSPTSNGARTDYRENYYLPAADVGLGASVDYDILTTKTAPKFKEIRTPNGTTNYTVENASRMRIDFIGNNPVRIGWALVYSTNAGAFHIQSGLGDNLAISSSSSGTLSITSTGAATSMYITIYAGDIVAASMT